MRIMNKGAEASAALLFCLRQILNYCVGSAFPSTCHSFHPFSCNILDQIAIKTRI